MTTAKPGGGNVTDCISCSAGYYCIEYSSIQYPCPKGFYCMSQQLPQPCPMYTYNNKQGMTAYTDCLLCPAGYFCNSTGISNYLSYACPQGYYCPNTTLQVSLFKCPAGTYNNLQATTSLSACKPCPEGSYCPAGTINPKVCVNGTYCPLNSTKSQKCQAGYYCPTEVASQLSCPNAFYCPSAGSDQYFKCANGTYCPSKSVQPTLCPSGSYGSSRSANANESFACITCNPGYYSVQGLNNCFPCPAGYVCLGNTTTASPLVTATDNGFLCPQGFYCPLKSSSATPCPMGTYGAKAGLQASSDCQLCPANTYGDAVGLTACKTCGGSSKVTPGSITCQCIGLNRNYLKGTKSCIC